MGVAHSLEEIEKLGGYYDDDGFYILEDESFYDPWGYYFDPNGYDEFGGYYDENGYYVPGEGYEDEYYTNYDHINDEEIEGYDLGDGVDHENPTDHDVKDSDLFGEHVVPAVQWLKELDIKIPTNVDKL